MEKFIQEIWDVFLSASSSVSLCIQHSRSDPNTPPKDELFTFVTHPEVNADNNHAERQIRPAVIMRKNSYCNRSKQGADTQAILMSIFRTLYLRKIDAITTITNSLCEWLKTGNITPLLAVSLQMTK